jgi:hypothetical protein
MANITFGFLKSQNSLKLQELNFNYHPSFSYILQYQQGHYFYLY